MADDILLKLKRSALPSAFFRAKVIRTRIIQVRRPKGVSSKREAFPSRAARASAAAPYCNSVSTYFQVPTILALLLFGCLCTWQPLYLISVYV